MKPFFSLLNGALDYDCSSCEAACCRGGYGTAVMHGAEWANLKQKYPLLSHFAIDQGKYIYLINHGPKCFFLNHQYRCQIEQENRRIEKPLQCRIFPYQVCGRVQGRPLVRAGLLCPFAINENLEGNIRSENFYREIGDTSVVEKVYDIFDVELASYLANPLSLEKSIIESSKEYFTCGDLEGFLFEQLNISQTILRESRLTDAKIDISSHQIMRKMVFQQCKFLGIDLEDLDFDKKGIGRSMISISPILRSLMLERHPYFQVGYLLALYLYSLISKQIQDDSFTVQTIANINLQLGGKLEFLALFPFFMVPKGNPQAIKDKAKNLFDAIQAKGGHHYANDEIFIDSGDSDDSGELTGIRRSDMAGAFRSLVEDLLQGEVFGSAACRHFTGFQGSSKNQVIEFYIRHFSSLFIQSLDEESFLSGKKCNNSRMGMTQQSVWSMR